MFSLNTHNNSKEYFRNLNIKKNSIYVTSTMSLGNSIRSLSKIEEIDKWRIIDIENFKNSIYSKWTNIINRNRLLCEIRKIIIELRYELDDEILISELKYLEDNISVLVSDIVYLCESNIRNLEYSNYSTVKHAFKLVYNRIMKTECFNRISTELMKPIQAEELCQKVLKVYNKFNKQKQILEIDPKNKIEKIYFYNVNNLDFGRWLLIKLLEFSGFEVVFNIPYFEGLDVTNRCWDLLYKNDKFLWNYHNDKFINLSAYVNFLEGRNNIDHSKENVVTKTYRGITEFKNELGKKNIITFYEDSLKSCMDYKDSIDHYFQTDIGSFLNNLYQCKLEDGQVFIESQVYIELITSGWIEYNTWNGVRLKEFLFKNQEYFNGIRTMDDILERINALKELEEVNDIFEDKCKSKIKIDEQKRLLVNPLRSLGYNNLEKYYITASYLLTLTNRLKNFIVKAFNNEHGLIDTEKHFELLKKIFKNHYIVNCSKNGSDIEVNVTRRIWWILNNHKEFANKMHKDDIKDLFTILLKYNRKNDQEEKNSNNNFSIDQLEGIILRDSMTNEEHNNSIYICDLSYKAYEMYINKRKIAEKILGMEDFIDIVQSSLSGKHREVALEALNMQKISMSTVEYYVKYIFANLFINFKGRKEFSWISELRKNDSKSIIFKQIESLYENSREIKADLNFINDLTEEELLYEGEPQCKIEELQSNYSKYSEVAYRNLDFCDRKFLYSSVLEAYPMYNSNFHHKLVFSSIVSILKNSIEDSYSGIRKFLFPLFPQWKQVQKQNILVCEYGRKNLQENYKYFDGINYPKNIDALFLLKSKYVIGENWKIKNRYNKGNFKAEEYYKEFIKMYSKNESFNNGHHCTMCPHILICNKGVFTIDK